MENMKWLILYTWINLVRYCNCDFFALFLCFFEIPVYNAELEFFMTSRSQVLAFDHHCGLGHFIVLTFFVTQKSLQCRWCLSAFQKKIQFTVIKFIFVSGLSWLFYNVFFCSAGQFSKTGLIFYFDCTSPVFLWNFGVTGYLGT